MGTLSSSVKPRRWQHRLAGRRAGEVVKVISALLEHLPSSHRYKVVFMERAVPEILASQKKMLAHRKEEAKVSDAEMEQQFRDHVKAVKYWLARQPNLEVLYVDYNRMMAAPEADCRRVAEFVGLPVDVDRMLSVPNQALYRNRT
jgi:DNA-binding NtrC family response regulator